VIALVPSCQASKARRMVARLASVGSPVVSMWAPLGRVVRTGCRVRPGRDGQVCPDRRAQW
jgi:hypothetical protein